VKPGLVLVFITQRLRLGLAAVALAAPAVVSAMVPADAIAQGNPVARSTAAQNQRDRDAARTYGDARNELEIGHAAQAQALFEQLIARFPDSPLADVARQDLRRMGARVPPPAGNRPPAIEPASRTADIVDAQRLQRITDVFRHKAGDRVFFAEASFDIGTRARAAIEAQAQWLISEPSVTAVVEGHADERGTREYNQQLSEKRAEVVRQRLIDLGVGAERLTLVGHGRDRLLAVCPDGTCAPHNRRVVIVPTGTRQAAAPTQPRPTVADTARDGVKPAEAR
jgi:outer membrane protein OmpA-like peptidoglycan-associated protein